MNNNYSRSLQITLFAAAIAACLLGFISPPVALGLGLAFALILGHPYKPHNAKTVKYLLQFSVVGLGFGLNFGEVVKAGSTGVMFTVVSIAATLAAGLLIGRWLAVKHRTAQLISFGTAICGGSAIAAMAPILNAHEDEISVALGTIFILNAAALFIFPPAGHALGLSQQQFGMWSAIAIHDTSSVVGAAAKYGEQAVKLATTVKLTRALWIVPLSLLAAYATGRKGVKISVPYFIFFFVLASVTVTVLPSLSPAYSVITKAAKAGLTVTLFLIGAGLSRETLKQVGLRPVMQGILLWIFVSAASLLVIKYTVI